MINLARLLVVVTKIGTRCPLSSLLLDKLDTGVIFDGANHPGRHREEVTGLGVKVPTGTSTLRVQLSGPNGPRVPCSR